MLMCLYFYLISLQRILAFLVVFSELCLLSNLRPMLTSVRLEFIVIVESVQSNNILKSSPCCDVIFFLWIALFKIFVLMRSALFLSAKIKRICSFVFELSYFPVGEDRLLF